MIGIFDSGLGGLTVLKALRKKLPEYDYLYLGDNARAPYGNKTEEVVFSYTCEALDFLFKTGCTLVIIACNTVSAKALRRVQSEYLPEKQPDKKVLGVLIPAAEAANEYFLALKKPLKEKRIGIIATRATVASRSYEKEIAKLDSSIKVESHATPLLVPLVEEGWLKKPETKKILKKYLRPLKEKKTQALILGCTHYPFLQKQIQEIMGKRVSIIDTPGAVADKLVDYLSRHPAVAKQLNKNQRIKFYTTDDTPRFRELGEKFLGEKIKDLEKIKL